MESTARPFSRRTAAFVLALSALPAAALALAILIPRHLPFVDLPQDVALVSIWQQLDAGLPAFRGRYEINLATPYVTGYLIEHAIAPLVGPETAVRLVLFLALVLVPISVAALLRAYRRPPELAIAAFLVAFSWTTFMGFVEFVVALPLVVLGAVAASRIRRVRQPATVALALLAIGAFLTHALALPMLAVVGAAAAVGSRRRMIAVAVALAPALVIAIAWLVGRGHEPSPDPMRLSFGDPFARLAIDGYAFGSGGLEPRALIVTLGVLVVAVTAWVLARRSAERGGPPSHPRDIRSAARSFGGAALHGDRGPVLLLCVAVAGYLLAPRSAFDAYGIWQRFAPLVFVFALVVVPWPTGPRPRVALAGALAAFAAFSSLATLAQSQAFDTQVAGLDAVVGALPKGDRLFFEPPTTAAAGVDVAALRHLSAYYIAAGGGDIDYNFAMFPHMVVRERIRVPYVQESPVYQLYLVYRGSCAGPSPQRPLGPILVADSRWAAFAVNGPIERPPTEPPDVNPPNGPC